MRQPENLPAFCRARAGLLLAARSLLISADSIDYEVRDTLSLGS